ncbi:hypothetical protein D9757_005461 [Collybiopsis confluens]|uniref:TRAF-type domain-containing protein n=1 Tax=Collybiopsis confluens TaxID=2823264 RepID=A0A8H5M9H6_9AGAR|nr:hypothetical protein D9757_005461 [Collybiopsis confluens]
MKLLSIVLACLCSSTFAAYLSVNDQLKPWTGFDEGVLLPPPVDELDSHYLCDVTIGDDAFQISVHSSSPDEWASAYADVSHLSHEYVTLINQHLRMSIASRLSTTTYESNLVHSSPLAHPPSNLTPPPTISCKHPIHSTSIFRRRIGFMHVIDLLSIIGVGFVAAAASGLAALLRRNDRHHVKGPIIVAPTPRRPRIDHFHERPSIDNDDETEYAFHYIKTNQGYLYTSTGEQTYRSKSTGWRLWQSIRSLKSLAHSPQCPIDRSPLRIEDIHSADPIVRSLVEELEVKCSNEPVGCPFTCQRQLLDAHTRTDCPYTLLSCPRGTCEEEVLRKDIDEHVCAHTQAKCQDCEESIKYSEHIAPSAREDYSGAKTVKLSSLALPQSYGCPWGGRRIDLSPHLASCPYEAIKGFFTLQRVQKDALTNENTLLKRRADTLESQLRVAQYELRCAQSALGPWFRNSKSRSTPTHPWSPSSQAPIQLQPSLSSTSRPSASPPESSSISQYFPDLTSEVGHGSTFSPRMPSEDEFWTQALTSDRLDSTARHTHRASFSGVPNQAWQGTNYQPSGSRSHQNVVAPLNLNTSLEGSLEGLRESIMTLSTSIDSLGRRSDIALTNETLRLNEEIMSLRATLHGLRMQVHTIMMDRNAQVTGRGQGIDPLFAQGDTWLNMNPNRGPMMPNVSPNSITKL